jgi:hypothetical protein
MYNPGDEASIPACHNLFTVTNCITESYGIPELRNLRVFTHYYKTFSAFREIIDVETKKKFLRKIKQIKYNKC